MNTNHKLILQFYTAFNQRDWKTMNASYHPQSTFYDPAFRKLDNKKTKAMWHMLCANAKDLTVEVSEVTADERFGSCRWDAWYSFSKTGRSVHNVIHAKFEFRDGLIFSHHDNFDFWSWSRMALGTSGLLLGWSSFFQNKVHQNAFGSLLKFIKQHSEYS